jgi:hypothetical protein
MWWIVLGFVASSAVGVAAAPAIARRGEPRLAPLPWNLYDMAKQHVPIIGGLARSQPMRSVRTAVLCSARTADHFPSRPLHSRPLDATR